MRLFPLIALMATTLSAQWLHQPTPGVPRLANRQPDLSAVAPKTSTGTPDISGMWRILPSKTGADFTKGLRTDEIQPWAAELHQRRVHDLWKDSPSITCLPLGPLASAFGTPDGLKIVQTPQLIVFLYPDLSFRQIFMDGRALEKDPSPSWMGYSVGRWENDTLVIESNGYKDRSWLDVEGHPHSESLRVTERLRRTSLGVMELAVTYDDPPVYSRPLQIDTRMVAVFDTEILEYVCAEGEKDKEHLIGTASDDPTVEVPSEQLSGYAGIYSLPNPSGPGVIPIEVALSEGVLTVDHPLLGKVSLRPIGERAFSGGGTGVRFLEENGWMVVVFSAVEGEFRATRKNLN